MAASDVVDLTFEECHEHSMESGQIDSPSFLTETRRSKSFSDRGQFRKRKASAISSTSPEEHEGQYSRRSWSVKSSIKSSNQHIPDESEDSNITFEILSEDETDIEEYARFGSLSSTESDISFKSIILIDDDFITVDDSTTLSRSKRKCKHSLEDQASGPAERGSSISIQTQQVYDLEPSSLITAGDGSTPPGLRITPHINEVKSFGQRDLIVLDDEDEASMSEPGGRRSRRVGVRQRMGQLSIKEKSQSRSAEEQDSAEHIAIDYFRGDGFTCRPGKGVQLHDGSFMRIESMFEDRNKEVFLRGRRLCRQNHDIFQTTDEIRLIQSGRRERNEVIWYQNYVSKRSSKYEQAFVKPVTTVLRNRDIIFTNRRYPSISINDDGRAFETSQSNADRGPIFCRWKLTQVYDSFDRQIEKTVEQLHHSEADKGSRHNKSGVHCEIRIEDVKLRYSWKIGPTRAGGSYKRRKPLIDIDGAEKSFLEEKYTFGDAFCGAGGASRGATDAGFSIKWSFDQDKEASASYRANFDRYDVECFQVAVDQFLQTARSRDLGVDVLHISPPCQFFAQSHTIPSPESDEKNTAALLSVWQLIGEIKPRVLTIEQTFSLLNDRHKEWFSSVLQACITQGYSVRWKVLLCRYYGVPQLRKRLFIIAAGPGEKLPPFPPPTHGAENLKKLFTIQDAINDISPIEIARYASRKNITISCAPFPMDSLAKTITCGGGQGNYHPSGERHYIPRELAALQTFPKHHSFAGAKTTTTTKRQIGNAVPPVLAKAVFREIIKSLRESDRL